MNYEAQLRQAEAMRKQSERISNRLEKALHKREALNELITQLMEEKHKLEDARTVFLSRLGRSAEETLNMLESIIPAPQLSESDKPIEVQEQDAPETEVNLEKTE